MRTVVSEFCASAGKETNWGCPQTRSADASVIACVLLPEYWFPTAAQLPADTHDTESTKKPASNVWTVDHTPLLDETA